MGGQPTCGQGLAAHAALPSKLGELTATVAEILETHTAALDLEDENARRERDVYEKLVAEHRQTAAELRSTAQEMQGYGTLPMALHDPDALFSPAAVRSFERFVAVEEELLALLRDRLRQDREMLGGMRRAA
jgi:hypothetical protein